MIVYTLAQAYFTLLVHNVDLSELTTSFEVKEDTLSLYKAVKDDPKDKIEVEIGDSKDSSKIYPQAKIMRWDNEVNFSLRYKDGEGEKSESVESKDDTFIWSKGQKEVHIYEKPEIAEDGGLEIEVVLKEKPISNVVEFSIQTKGLDFFYQPELTKEEVEQGSDRPEDVVGSYAVYYKNSPANVVGGKEYKVGKLCHIYRPEVIDAKGNKVWGELNVNTDKGLLTVTIDEKWLEKAVYPVIVDPTFGYTSVGASNTFMTANYILANIYSGAAGTGSSMSVYAKQEGVSGKMALYLVGDKTLVAETSSFTFSTNASWNTSNFTTTPTLTSSDYYLCRWGNSTYTAYYDTASIPLYYLSRTFSLGYPATISFTGNYNSNRVSIYATYTASASGPTGVKTINGTAIASVKTVNATAIASVKTING